MNPDVMVWLLASPVVGAILLYLARGRVQQALAVVLPAVYLALGATLVVGGRAAFPLRTELFNLPWLDEAGVLPLRLDALSAVLLLVVLVVGLLVMAFSLRYMGPANREHPVVHGEGNHRYYAFLSLFIASMIAISWCSSSSGSARPCARGSSSRTTCTSPSRCGRDSRRS
jgi:NADH:ubiquinone oxidoreductase subunit 5 (subunit L)/multisubunit Na+/H+ antiporter MnhA subunit